jgi:hypothetical protein
MSPVRVSYERLPGLPHGIPISGGASPAGLTPRAAPEMIDRNMRRRRTLTGVFVAMGLTLAIGVSLSIASSHANISGTWSCCGSGGAGAQTWTIKSVSSGGAVSGSGGGGGITFPITGHVSGNSVTLTTGPYNQLKTYTATFKGTVSSNGKSMSGTWSSDEHQSGTWTATRTSAPPKKHGSAKCVVPKLKGDSLAAAKHALKKAHCGVGKVTRARSHKVAKGDVVKTKPGSGSKHKSGTRVNITVSRG